MKAPAFVFLVLALFLRIPAGSAQNGWPRYGHDGRLTGHTSGSGSIRSPRVAWRYSAAGVSQWVEMIPALDQHSLNLPQTDIASGSRDIHYPVEREIDVSGDGNPVPVSETFHERWAKILPDVPGWQRVAWNETWTDQEICRLQLFAYDEGADTPRMVWETDPPESVIFNPLDVVYDIDGDGVKEILVAAHYRVMIFEATTGRKETELRYHGNRPYGWFGLADIDGDGTMELVTIGDFQSHIDVLDYDPSLPEPDRLSVIWRRDIETNIDERQKWPQVGPRPLVDVTGDGLPEIVLNLFNDTGDGRWHTVVIDPTNGKELHDLAGRYSSGSADVNGDGAEDIFLMAAERRLVPEFGRTEIVTIGADGPRVLWTRPWTGWAKADLPRLGDTWSTSATGGMEHVLIAEGPSRLPVFAVRELEQDRAMDSDSRPRVSLTALVWDASGEFREQWRVGGLDVDDEVLALDTMEDGGVGALVVAEVEINGSRNLVAQGASLRVVKSGPLESQPAPPITARLDDEGGMSAVMEGPGETIIALSPPGEDSAGPEILWQRPGRGGADGSRLLGPVAADLDGDGGMEILAADRAPDGSAVLVAYDGDGSVLWRHPFETTSGGTPVWNHSALTFWWPGRFRSPDRPDVFVNTRRGLMHSDEGHLLDGSTGRSFWTQKKAVWKDEFSWGYAGIPVAVADVTGNGLDEIICLYPVCFWVADGPTGNLLAGKELSSREEVNAWAAYGEPLVHDFTGDGTPDVLLDSPYVLALLDLEGKPIWQNRGRDVYPKTPGEAAHTTRVRHALVDLDGDGTFEIASAGYGDGVRVYDPRDGSLLWSLEAPAATCNKVAAADIDGVPGDEIIFPAGIRLVAVGGDRKGGRIVWEWDGPSTLSVPAVADMDGDGRSEILVTDAMGSLFCLDDEDTPEK